MNRVHTIRNQLLESLGPAERYYRDCAVFQIYIFVLLISVGSFAHESLASLLPRLIAVAQIVFFNIVVQSRGRTFHSAFVLLQSASLVLLLAVLSLYLQLDPFLSVCVPTALLLVTLSVVALPLPAIAVLAAAVFPILSVSLFASQLLGVASDTALFVGAPMVVTGMLFLVARNYMHTESPEDIAPESMFEEDVAISNRGTVSASIATEREWYRVLAVADAVRLEEAIHEFAWRLPFAGLFVAVSTLFLAWEYQLPRFSFGLSWLAATLFELYVITKVFRQRNSFLLYVFAVLASFCLMLWWFPLVLLEGVPIPLADVFLLVLFVMICSVPAPQSLLIASCVLCSAMLLGRLPLAASPWAFGLAGLAVLVTALRTAIVRRQEIAGRTAMRVLGYCISQGLRARTVGRALARYSAEAVGAQSAIVRFSASDVEIIRHDTIVPYDDKEHAADVLSNRAQQEQSGVTQIDVQDLCEDLRNYFLDWFSGLPSRVFVLRAHVPSSETDESLECLVPVQLFGRMYGTRRCRNSLIEQVRVVSSWIQSSRGQLSSLERLEAVEKQLRTRDEELGTLVHAVNNVAQTLSSLAESIRSTELKAEELERIGRKVKASTRYLAAAASDVRILRDMARPFKSNRTERIVASTLFEGLEDYLQYAVMRNGRSIHSEFLCEGNEVLPLNSIDQFEASLRYVSTRMLHVMDGDRCVLRATRDGDCIRFIFSVPCSEVAVAKIALSGSQDPTMHSVWTTLSDAAKRCELDANEQEQCIRVLIECSIEIPRLRTQSDIQGWALFVDDQPEIATYYSRVAEALELEHRIANSAEEALELIDLRGAPSILVTDIQLGGKSGLDLVQNVRARFGAALPVIVVSGNTEDGIAEKVKEAGGSRYLTKPVGRQRLFAEIRDVLNLLGD